MPRTTSGVRSTPAARLADLARQWPEWETWIGLLQRAWSAAEDQHCHPDLDQGATAPPDPDRPAPVLHRRTLRLNDECAGGLVRELASAAGLGGGAIGGVPLSDDDSLALISAAIRQDNAVIQSVAAGHGADLGAMGAVAQLAALPLLQLAGRKLQAELPRYWPAGYCPVCGAWPTLAEQRGLDRSRRLRCGRCAADWEVQWLYCIYCGERDHKRLGSLTPDDRGDQQKVETCASCRGYLKSFPTLQGLPPLELLIRDLETIELDLVALDRNYRRPAGNGFPVRLQVVSHAPSPGL